MDKIQVTQNFLFVMFGIGVINLILMIGLLIKLFFVNGNLRNIQDINQNTQEMIYFGTEKIVNIINDGFLNQKTDNFERIKEFLDEYGEKHPMKFSNYDRKLINRLLRGIEYCDNKVDKEANLKIKRKKK